jgi:hypothetical protein
MGIISTDEQLAAQVFLQSKTVQRIHVPLIFHETILLITTWIALKHLIEEYVCHDDNSQLRNTLAYPGKFNR